MKKLLLIISLCIPLLFSNVNIDVIKAENTQNNDECNSNYEESIVKIVNNYNIFKGNGFVYKVNDKYAYIVTSSKVVSNSNNFKIIYSNNEYKNAIIIGYDSNNEVAVFRTEKTKDIKGVCIGDSNYIYRGEKVSLSGYYDKENSFYLNSYIADIGDLYSKNNYINIYKNIVNIQGNNIYKGVGIFDAKNRLIGMITNHMEKLNEGSFFVESNKIIKIADSIVKTGKYNVNYIKYSLVDYASLSSNLRESYNVSSKASTGVVITKFKPLRYIFGGLNQGMVIVAVNGIKINNTYELDKQFSRYEKKSSVCLKVIKSNGKIAFYYVNL